MTRYDQQKSIFRMFQIYLPLRVFKHAWEIPCFNGNIICLVGLQEDAAVGWDSAVLTGNPTLGMERICVDGSHPDLKLPPIFRSNTILTAFFLLDLFIFRSIKIIKLWGYRNHSREWDRSAPAWLKLPGVSNCSCAYCWGMLSNSPT